jgi:hypothetical protein
MAVVYATTLKNTRMGDVVTAIGTAGKIKIGTAAMASVLAQISLANPAGTVNNGVLTFAGVPLTEQSADANGTAAAAQVVDSAGDVIISGLTVSSSSGDIILSSTNIVAGQPVTITAASITHG